MHRMHVNIASPRGGRAYLDRNVVGRDCSLGNQGLILYGRGGDGPLAHFTIGHTLSVFNSDSTLCLLLAVDGPNHLGLASSGNLASELRVADGTAEESEDAELLRLLIGRGPWPGKIFNGTLPGVDSRSICEVDVIASWASTAGDLLSASENISLCVI